MWLRVDNRIAIRSQRKCLQKAQQLGRSPVAINFSGLKPIERSQAQRYGAWGPLVQLVKRVRLP